MKTIEINEFKISDAPTTGIGWVSVEKWNPARERYEHVAIFRSRQEAEKFISEKNSREET